MEHPQSYMPATAAANAQTTQGMTVIPGLMGWGLKTLNISIKPSLKLSLFIVNLTVSLDLHSFLEEKRPYFLLFPVQETQPIKVRYLPKVRASLVQRPFHLF